MKKASESLAYDVLVVLKRAILENEMEAADHLLTALEVLACHEDAYENASRVSSKLIRSIRRKRDA